jgi:hypothetical protein
MSVLRDSAWYVVMVAIMALALIATAFHPHVGHAPNVRNATARAVAHDSNYCASLSRDSHGIVRTVYPC